MSAALTLCGCSSLGADEDPLAPTQSTPQIPQGTPGPTSTGNEQSTEPTTTSTDSSPRPIPNNAVGYADALVISWGAGEQERMEQLATPEVLEVLAEYGDAGGPHWDQVGYDAGAGSVFVSYENSAESTKLELRVQNEAASEGQEQAVVEAKFVD